MELCLGISPLNELWNKNSATVATLIPQLYKTVWASQKNSSDTECEL